MSIAGKAAKITTNTLQEMKQAGEKITMLTAYDFSMARILDAAGIDVILGGDSASNVMAGTDTTVPITLDQMIYHEQCVVNGVNSALIVCDMPFGSYQGDSRQALNSAIRIMKESGSHAVKLEGGAEVVESIERILTAGIPVMGHLGLTPQSIYKFGTYSVRAREEEEAAKLIEDAKLLEKSGCFAIVLEKIPAELAAKVTAAVNIPTIGIGAGGYVDGQVLVYHDLIGMKSKEYIDAKFVKRYSNQYQNVVDSMKSFKNDIEKQTFPTENHSYDAGELTENNIKEWKKEVKKILS